MAENTGTAEIEVEKELEEENRQVGKEVPPAGLRVFQHGTQFPTVKSLISILLMEPVGSGRRRGSGGWIWSRRSS